MRYFFYLAGGGRAIADTTGTILSGPDAARRHAATLAAELAQDGENYRGYTVYIVDEYGSDIGKVRVVAAPYDSAG